MLGRKPIGRSGVGGEKVRVGFSGSPGQLFSREAEDGEWGKTVGRCSGIQEPDCHCQMRMRIDVTLIFFVHVLMSLYHLYHDRVPVPHFIPLSKWKTNAVPYKVSLQSHSLPPLSCSALTRQ